MNIHINKQTILKTYEIYFAAQSTKTKLNYKKKKKRRKKCTFMNLAMCISSTYC